jgi:hypothetical protein
MKYNNQFGSFAKEQPVQFMLVSADAGLNLISKEFEPYLSVDETIMSGFLTAFTTFSSMYFTKRLNQLRFGKYTLLMRIEQPFLFCYIFRGDLVSAKGKLNEFIHQFRSKKDVWNSLSMTAQTGEINYSDFFEIENTLSHVFSPNV